MKCPQNNFRCSKYNTVRHCPGCPVWEAKKAARRMRMEQAQTRTQIPGVEADAFGAQIQEIQGASGQPSGGMKPRIEQPTPPASMGGDAPTAHTPLFADGLSFRQTDLLYQYDGSLEGLYCCFHESMHLQELPVEIVSEHNAQPSLMGIKEIPTDAEMVGRVRAYIRKTMSEGALDLLETVHFTCLRQKELQSLRFVALGLQEGSKVMGMLGHPLVAPLLAAEKHLMREAHLLKGFVRFSDYGGVLAAHISPKNFVLPFLAGHFCARYAEETFVIYDRTHKAGLIYQDRKRSIVHLEEMPFPEADAQEERYRVMWKRFYHTIAIEARINPKLRMTHMPKRYWENMTEMSELL